jgi:hypothetical protein
MQLGLDNLEIEVLILI